MLNSLKNRGVQDVMIICADGLPGFREAIETAFPDAEYQEMHRSSDPKHTEICLIQRQKELCHGSQKYIPGSERGDSP